MSEDDTQDTAPTSGAAGQDGPQKGSQGPRLHTALAVPNDHPQRSAGNSGIMHPTMVANRWQKGVSGNPKGRPHKKTFEEICNDVLDETVTGTDGEKMTRRELLARLIVSQAVRPDPRWAAVSTLVDRLWLKGPDGEKDTRAEVHIHIDADDADA